MSQVEGMGEYLDKLDSELTKVDYEAARQAVSEIIQKLDPKGRITMSETGPFDRSWFSFKQLKFQFKGVELNVLVDLAIEKKTAGKLPGGALSNAEEVASSDVAERIIKALKELGERNGVPFEGEQGGANGESAETLDLSTVTGPIFHSLTGERLAEGESYWGGMSQNAKFSELSGQPIDNITTGIVYMKNTQDPDGKWLVLSKSEAEQLEANSSWVIEMQAKSAS